MDKRVANGDLKEIRGVFIPVYQKRQWVLHACWKDWNMKINIMHDNLCTFGITMKKHGRNSASLELFGSCTPPEPSLLPVLLLPARWFWCNKIGESVIWPLFDGCIRLWYPLGCIYYMVGSCYTHVYPLYYIYIYIYPLGTSWNNGFDHGDNLHKLGYNPTTCFIPTHNDWNRTPKFALMAAFATPISESSQRSLPIVQ